MNADLKRFAKETKKIFERAVTSAQEANREMGIAKVYSRGGKVHFETLPLKDKKPPKVSYGPPDDISSSTT